MNKAQAIKEVQSAPIGPHVDRVCELLRPCIKMSPGNEGPRAQGSRFGGHVLLPPGIAWPEWDSVGHFGPLIETTEDEIKKIKAVLQRQGIQDARRYEGQERWLERARRIIAGGSRRMNFLARICLKELAGLQCGLGLPRAGVISIFYDVDVKPGGWAWSRDGWRVIFSDGADEVDHGLDAHVPWKEKCLSMEFSEEWTLPTDYSRVAPDLELDEEYDFLGERLRGEYTKMHHLGGWADEIQGDAGPPPDIRGDAEWLLLLQLASDSRQEASGLGWCWGDAGNLFFWIKREDLAATRFENVWCGFQCS